MKLHPFEILSRLQSGTETVVRYDEAQSAIASLQAQLAERDKTILEQQALLDMQHKALGKLAMLGNGDMWGSSEGNRIAQDAMTHCDLSVLEAALKDERIKTLEDAADCLKPHMQAALEPEAYLRDMANELKEQL